MPVERQTGHQDQCQHRENRQPHGEVVAAYLVDIGVADPCGEEGGDAHVQGQGSDGEERRHADGEESDALGPEQAGDQRKRDEGDQVLTPYFPNIT